MSDATRDRLAAATKGWFGSEAVCNQADELRRHFGTGRYRRYVSQEPELARNEEHEVSLARRIPELGGEQFATEVNRAWAEIFAEMSGDDGYQLLRAHWLATRNPDEQSWRGVDSIKQALGPGTYSTGATRRGAETPGSRPDEGTWHLVREEVGRYLRSLRDFAQLCADSEPATVLEELRAAHRDHVSDDGPPGRTGGLQAEEGGMPEPRDPGVAGPAAAPGSSAD